VETASKQCPVDFNHESPEHAAHWEASFREMIPSQPQQLRRWNLAYTFEIYPQWRHRFAPGTTHNTEHVFSLALPQRVPVTLAPDEHVASLWLPAREAAAKCFSWSNRDAIGMLGACAR